MPRRTGKYGCKPPDPEKRGPVFERYLDPRAKLTPVPAFPAVALTADVDYSSAVPAVLPYLNFTLGCCGVAMMGHSYGAWSWYASGTEAVFDDSEIIKTYSRVGGYVPGNAATDKGVLLTDLLADQVTNGMTDTAGKVHKLAGWATFGDPTDADLIGQALSVFGSLGGGYILAQQNETQFSDEQPWDYTAGAAPAGGHAVCLQRRYPDQASDADPFEYWTWGARQRATQAFVTHQTQELHVMVSADWVRVNGTSVEGMDLQQLLADTHAV